MSDDWLRLSRATQALHGAPMWLAVHPVFDAAWLVAMAAAVPTSVGSGDDRCPPRRARSRAVVESVAQRGEERDQVGGTVRRRVVHAVAVEVGVSVDDDVAGPGGARQT